MRFGTFELNVRTGELVSVGTAAAEAGSAKILLREQPFQILRILVERQGEIVTHQEIRQILWPDDTVVEFDRRTYAALGRQKQSDAALKELIAKYSSRDASDVAWVYAFRNRRDEAFEWLDRAYAQREGNVAYTNVDRC